MIVKGWFCKMISFSQDFKDFPLENVYIVLIQPETDGNIGSIARVMKNFGFSKLVLINPYASHQSDDAKMFAMKARDILDNAEILHFDEKDILSRIRDYFSAFNVVIGTSAKGYSYKNIKRIPIFPYELDFTKFLSFENVKIALVFGRESTGLTNEELSLMDFLVRIPTNPEYPTLNISQAVGVLLYSIYLQLIGVMKKKNEKGYMDADKGLDGLEGSIDLNSNKDLQRGQAIPSTKEERDRLLNLLYLLLERTPVPDYRYIRTKHALRNWVGRAFLSKKEVSLLYNFFKKVNLCYSRPSLIDSEKKHEE